MFLVYRTTNKINHKIYVGCHTTEDINDDYLGSGKALYNAIRKYGRDSFVREILYICDSKEEMYDREREIVTEEFCARKDTYNIRTGGFGGWEFARRYLSDPDVIKRRNQNSAKALKTAEVRDKISDGLRQRWSDRGGGSWVGKEHSEATIEKMKHVKKDHGKGSTNSQYGTCWITNGAINKKIKSTLLDSYEALGYRKGRIMNVCQSGNWNTL